MYICMEIRTETIKKDQHNESKWYNKESYMVSGNDADFNNHAGTIYPGY